MEVLREEERRRQKREKEKEKGKNVEALAEVAAGKSEGNPSNAKRSFQGRAWAEVRGGGQSHLPAKAF